MNTLEKDTKTLVTLNSKEEAIEYASKHFIETAKQSIETRGYFFVALSGGSTPKAIFQTLASNYSSAIDWGKVYLFWSDERAVEKDDDNSNYNMAITHGLQKLPIKSAHIFRMKAETNIADNAKDYEKIIQTLVPNASFDLIMLGMGEDGHTASLFPNTKALEEKTHLVVDNYIDEKKCFRMTFTFPLLNQAKQTVFYVLGSSKRKKIKEIFLDGLSFPSSQVGTKENKALWIADKDASELLNL